MKFEELWQRFTTQGIETLTPGEIEYMLYFQSARIRTLEREGASAIRMSGVSAGDISISGVTVNHGR